MNILEVYKIGTSISFTSITIKHKWADEMDRPTVRLSKEIPTNYASFPCNVRSIKAFSRSLEIPHTRSDISEENYILRLQNKCKFLTCFLFFATVCKI